MDWDKITRTLYRLLAVGNINGEWLFELGSEEDELLSELTNKLITIIDITELKKNNELDKSGESIV